MDLVNQFVSHMDWQIIIFKTLRILFLLIGVWILLKVVRVAMRKLQATLVSKGRAEGEPPSETQKRAETLARLVRQGVVILIWVMAILVILREVGVEIAPILASAGIVGLAVGFGAQNLVRDVISGFFMILENQIRVGDVAVVNGTGGLVERLNFRTIVLRDLSGTVHVFPNGMVKTLANLTREWSAYVFDISVAYKEDVDRVMEIMATVGSQLKQDTKFGSQMVADIEIFGLDNFADSAVVIKGRIKTKPIKQWEVGREYRRRLKLAFDEQGIEIPFPQRSLHFNEADHSALTALLGQASSKDEA